MDDRDLTRIQETPETLEAEQKAFEKSFIQNRPDDSPYVDPAVPAEPVVTESGGSYKEDGGNPVPNEPVEAKGAPAEIPNGDGITPTPAEPVEQPRLIAGLTEEQLQAALSRSAGLQNTVDKMAGRIGQLMQQIDALKKNPPTTQAAQQAFDLKLEKLSAAFPELANMLREDLQTLQQPSPALAETPPNGITQEQLDKLLEERLQATNAKMSEQIETKVLTIVHPDWLEIIKTPQFVLWRDNVLGPEEGQKLMQSEDSVHIIGKLNEFKAWRAASAAPVEPAVQPVVKKTQRLTNAVLPAGASPAPVAGPMTEDEAFAIGFKTDRERSGRAA